MKTSILEYLEESARKYPDKTARFPKVKDIGIIQSILPIKR